MPTRDLTFVVEDDMLGTVEWVPPTDLQRVVNGMSPEAQQKVRLVVESLLVKAVGIVMAALASYERRDKFLRVLRITATGMSKIVRQLERTLNS